MSDRPLRIGVDGRELTGRPTGVGRYIREVLRVWAGDRSFPHDLIVFTPETPSPELTRALGPRVTWTLVSGGGRGTIWEQWYLPARIHATGIDVFFAGAYTAPCRLKTPYVLVIHDMSYFAHPEWFGWREGMRRRWLTRVSAARARAVVTVSEFSASEIQRYLGVPRSRLRVALSGGPPAVTAASQPGSTVLFVGSLFTRRLIPELIAGFSLAAAAVAGARLVIVGDNRTVPRIDPRAIAAAHGVRDRVEWRDYVTDAELEELYASARVFAFLSTYEGFALTPLEAIAHGVPPVLLDTDVAREVYEDAALFVAPEPPSIGTALTALLRDEHVRESLVGEGKALLARRSWTHAAGVIRQVLEDRSD